MNALSKHIILLLTISSLITIKSYSQGCSENVPEFNADLTLNPDSSWYTGCVDRIGQCCEFQDSSFSCVRFNVIISNEAKGIILNVSGGTMPTSTNFKIIFPDENDCSGSFYHCGEIVCLVPEKVYTIVFCQPDGNHNNFTIKSVRKTTEPFISLNGVYSEGCFPHEVTFYDPKIANAEDYLWQFGDGESSNELMPYHTYSDSGLFNISLTITYGHGCIQQSVNEIFVHSLYSSDPAIKYFPANADMSNPAINFSLENEEITNALWDFGDNDTATALNITHTYKDSGNYEVTVHTINMYGCPNQSSTNIYISPGHSFSIPDAFIPNTAGPCGGKYNISDHNNEVFYPIVQYTKKYDFQIFNRWGELIFRSTDVSIGWDGYYKNTLCKQDVYTWLIDIIYIDGTAIKKSGYVTLLR